MTTFFTRLRNRHRQPPPPSEPPVRRCVVAGCGGRALADEVVCLLCWADERPIRFYLNRLSLCVACNRRPMLLTKEPALYSLCAACQGERVSR